MERREKGAGSLYQTKDKTWVYQFSVDGKRKTKRFQHKADAKAFINSLNIAAAQEQNDVSAKEGVITVGDWMDTWLEKYAKPTVRLSTYCSYEVFIRTHIRPELGGKYMNTLRAEDLQDFFVGLGENGNYRGGGLSVKSMTNIRNMMHLSFEQAVKNKVLKENLIETVRLPKKVKSEMRVLNREEQSRLIHAVKMSPEPAAFGIIFDLFTGLRMGELCGLRWENVDMNQGTIKICETRNRLPNHDDRIQNSTSVHTIKATKTDNSLRTVYLMKGLLQDFKSYYAIQMSIRRQDPMYNRDGYVFCQANGQPFEPRTYQDLFKRCVRRAGIADANFHSLRHTFATRCLEQGMDVVTLSKLLGHANPSITLDKYGHALNEHQRISVERLGDLYGDQPARQVERQVEPEEMQVESPAPVFQNDFTMQF